MEKSVEAIIPLLLLLHQNNWAKDVDVKFVQYNKSSSAGTKKKTTEKPKMHHI